jgi:hypothetical protein
MEQVTAHCSDCGTTLKVEPRMPCPNCGSKKRTYGIALTATLHLLGELGVEARDAANNLKAEVATRTDGQKEGMMHVDWTGGKETIQVHGSRSTRRIDKVKEENDCAEVFVRAINERDGRCYKVEAKKVEDSDFPDIWIRDDTLPKGHPEHRIGVQITHLDETQIAALGRYGSYDSALSVELLAKTVVDAIAKKQGYDKKEVSKTYLILITSYPIRQSLHNKIREAIRDLSPTNRYRETWVVPFHEPPFQIS